ncbi:hypothetical protein CMV30_11800 [Nibricoccus aquaticus]|uniref:Uncharacterized protein n=1 Tax=Nibricoccus aquaticus TaxID=2576891 RepID=A0A290QKZ8_9BACT|nr:hypothetical protein [Nibricoccus aquaticus]ATC64582.1 hypothetical protein CMV30_11800 [Nibricoccus aquaticus]
MNNRWMKGVLWISLLSWTAGSGAVWTWAKAARDRAEQERVVCEVRLQELKARFHAIEKRRSGVENAETNERAKADKAKADAEKTALMKALAPKQSEQRLDKDPQLQLLKLKALRADLVVKYGVFLREKKLTSEQIERLSAAWSDYEAAKLDIAAIRRDHKLGYDDPAVAVQRKEAQAALAVAEKAVLGEEGFKDFDQFRRMQPMRELVLGYVGKAALLGVPATEEQVTRVTEVLAAMNTNFRNGGQVQFGEMDWDAGWAKAREFMSAEQYELLVAETNERRTMHDVMDATVFIHEELAKEDATKAAATR